MPTSPARPCSRNDCYLMQPCPVHHARDSRPSWRQHLTSGSSRGYGWGWSALRRRILARDGGRCQPCLRAGRVTDATAVDHVQGKARGGTDAESNLESTCRTCHQLKTGRDSHA